MPDPLTSLRAEAWSLPLNAPFRVATRTAHEASNVLVTARAGALTGHGGAAPVGYVTGESPSSVLEAITAAAPAFEGLDTSAIGPLLDKARETLEHAPAARAGVEMALLDLWARGRRISLWRHFGAREEVLITDLTIPIVSPAEAAALTSDAAARGFDRFKVKAGDPGGLEADIERLRAVASAAPGAMLRIDANQAFTPDDAVRFIAALSDLAGRIELIEQPVDKSDIEGLRSVRERVSIPVFADEAARDPDAVRRLIREGAADGVNVKLMKSAIVGAAEIASICRAAGVRLMIGCMLESRLSLAAAVYLAAGLGGFTAVDLDAHLLLAPDPARRGGFREEGPRLIVERDGIGWGVEGL